MDMLRSMSKHNPNVIELMFATHPMSDERYSTVLEATSTQYKSAEDFPLHKDRYMDHTANLRLMKKAVEELQNGEKEMAKKNFRTAEEHFKRALAESPEDYAGFVMMAKCQLAQKKYGEAHRYAQLAKQVNPQEAQAYYVAGISKIEDKDYGAAREEFSKYENLLPGNPTIIFLKGYSLEGMTQIKEAAYEYQRYLEIVNQGEQAQHAYRRLVEWGYIKSPRR
jgi:tetratricopeptide (TPR) repeat protein